MQKSEKILFWVSCYKSFSGFMLCTLSSMGEPRAVGGGIYTPFKNLAKTFIEKCIQNAWVYFFYI